MMTFKDLKKLVELPSYKEQRVPTVKALEVSGVPVVAEKILENHGSISVYQNGYVIYRAHKRVTVFSLRNCVHYKYDALEGAGHHIEEEEFDEYEWHIRLVLEGEDRIFMNYEIIQGKWMPSREDREYKEEILEGVDEAVSTLERMISEERVEELLSTLTDLQRKVVHIHLFHGLSFTEAAKHLGMTRQNLTGIYNAAIYKMAYVTIPKDLSKVKNKVFLNLTKRQLICMGFAASIGVPFYFLTRGTLGTSNAAAGMVLLMLPEFFFALFEKNGMHLETILTNFINVRFKRPAVRRYEIENLYEYESEKSVTPKAKKGGIIGKRKG